MRRNNMVLYTWLDVPYKPWEDNNVDFVLGLPQTFKEKWFYFGSGW